MACNCTCNIIKATEVTVETPADAEAFMQVTVPATTVFTEGCYRIGLFTTIPNTVNCASVQISDGTTNYPVLKCDGDNWRPAQLKCRSVLNLRFLTDPEHFLIVRR